MDDGIKAAVPPKKQRRLVPDRIMINKESLERLENWTRQVGRVPRVMEIAGESPQDRFSIGTIMQPEVQVQTA
jgi:hypothetical protein